MKTTTSSVHNSIPKRSFAKRLAAGLMAVACSFCMLDTEALHKIAPDAIVEASAAGGGKGGKKTIVTTEPYTTTTTTETTTSLTTTETTGGKKTVYTTEAYTTELTDVTTSASTGSSGKKTVSTTESYTTTATETTTTTTQTTTTTSETTTTQTTTTPATTTYYTYNTGKKTVYTTASYTTTSQLVTTSYTYYTTGKKTIYTTTSYTTTSPVTTYTSLQTGKKEILTTSPYVYGPQAPEQEAYATVPAIPVDAEIPHKGYLPAGYSLFYFTYTMEDAAILAAYNGYDTLYNTVQPGWFNIPNGMACRVDTYVSIPAGSTLFSIIKNATIADEILQYNGGIYTSYAVVPAGMALYVNNEDFLKTVTTTQTANDMATTEATSYTTSETTAIEITASETTTTTSIPETTSTNVQESEQSETTTSTEDTRIGQLSEELANKEQQLQERENEKTEILSYLKSMQSFISTDLSKLIGGLKASDIGFVLGSDSNVLLKFNADGIFSVNCIAKPAVITLLLQECEKAGISLDTKMVIQPQDWVYSTWYTNEHGFKVGDQLSLLDCCYAAISMSDNVGYNIIKRYLKAQFGIDVNQWRFQKFGHQMDGGSYGKASANIMYAEAQYVLDYIKTMSPYSSHIANWLNMEDIYYDSVFLDNIDGNIKDNMSWYGFKIGWYGSTQTEMVFVKDKYGNWYIAIFLTRVNGTTSMTKIATWIDNEYDKLLKLIKGNVPDQKKV